ncbi:hypothetical protein ERO13_A07G076700v2 [Gossypium hirsutum]|uniref:Uncharacterized protein At1g66480 n=1 Tax=Gossypium hirsutum TaxID=3635 RepID=A0A1U8MDK5_GOSHI|nr:uncharacterized protein At1g66480 [Gossypium hirsutum]KAG4191193.1 hypothetical protein ERO13_A07G076700v2 [Gossypium hirsutum]
MGNSIGGRNKAKVMKIDGETIKLKTPIRVWDVLKDYPTGHVLLDSQTVKHYGIRAKPLEPQESLKPKKIYFLVELPKLADDEVHKAPRRVRSGGIHMSAKDRLECLMLSRRTVSDLSMVRPSSTSMVSDGVRLGGGGGGTSGGGMMTVKMRLPKSQMAKLVEESKDGVEVAEKILDHYIGNGGSGGYDAGNRIHREAPWKPGLGTAGENFKPKREKRVSFIPQEEGEIHLANQL